MRRSIPLAEVGSRCTQLAGRVQEWGGASSPRFVNSLSFFGDEPRPLVAHFLERALIGLIGKNASTLLTLELSAWQSARALMLPKLRTICTTTA